MAEATLPQNITRKQAIEQGLKHYFTGKPCKRGHVCEKSTTRHSCVECEKYTAQQWRKNNKEKCNNYSKNYRRKNPEKVRFTYKKWSEKNKERVVFLYQKWRSENIERSRELMRNCYARNPDLFKQHARLRKARKKGAEGFYKIKDVRKQITYQSYKCVYCDADISASYHIDHIVPLSKGGSNWPSNIQCLCARCNLRKNAKDHDQFRKEIELEKRARA